jgi:hypothetical protein
MQKITDEISHSRHFARVAHRFRQMTTLTMDHVVDPRPLLIRAGVGSETDQCRYGDHSR